MNVFDQNRSKCVIRKRKQVTSSFSEDFLCHQGWRYHSVDDDSLAHFGTKGMKWGVRRYQDEDGVLTEMGRQRYGINGKRSAYGMSRDLNKLDKEITRAQAKANRYKTKFEVKRSRKEYRAQKRGTEAPAKTKREAKLEKKASDYQKLADRGRKFTEQILASAKKNGKSVRMKDTKRHVNNGRNLLKSILGSAVLGPNGVYYTNEKAVGTKYKVRNDGRGTTARKKKYDRSVVKRNNYYIHDKDKPTLSISLKRKNK